MPCKFDARQPPIEQPRGYHVPTSSSFSLPISDTWKTTTDPIMKWVRDLPDPIQHREPVEPAHYHAAKHSLSYKTSSSGSSFDGHRNKRAKISSIAGRESASGSRRSRLVDSSRGLARRVSNACMRAVTPSGQHSISKRPGSCLRRGSTPAPEPTPSPGTPSFALIDRPKMRFVFVGDAECGKSSILLRYYRDAFTQDYTPTKYELFNKVVTVNGQDTDIELWDTAGDVTLEQLDRLSYLAWDAVFLCFSVNSARSYNHARTQWITQIRRHTGGAPLIFVGTKTDQRVGASLWSPLYPDIQTRITATEGAMTATALGAARYVECSAKTGQGINGIFEEGVRAVFERRAAIDESNKKNNFENHSRLAEFLCFK